MRYIIMCGGTYQKWETPRQLLKVKGETILNRTIRLLRENGVTDIAISTNNPAFQFENLGLPILHHENNYNAKGYNDFTGHWNEAFYPTDEPVCYIFGDVVFSPEAMRTIVQTETDDIEFFASAPPFPPEFRKHSAEPFALKVVNTKRFKACIQVTNDFDRMGLFARKPIMWELWQVIKATPLNKIIYTNYVVINDYTCDIDEPEDVQFFDAIF